LGAYCRGTARRSAAWCWWWHLGATRVRASHHPVHQRSGAATGASVHVSGGTPPFFSPMRCAGAGAALPTCRPVVVCHHHVITETGGGGGGGGRGARGLRDPRVPVGRAPPRVLPCPAWLPRSIVIRCGADRGTDRRSSAVALPRTGTTTTTAALDMAVAETAAGPCTRPERLANAVACGRAVLLLLPHATTGSAAAPAPAPAPAGAVWNHVTPCLCHARRVAGLALEPPAHQQQQQSAVSGAQEPQRRAARGGVGGDDLGSGTTRADSRAGH
jgi:hypothetical protein